jgi:hypothetical protein
MLESVCQSDTWNDDQLDGLGLLGLQPCFEDVILQLPVFIALIVISTYRIGLASAILQALFKPEMT